VKNFIIYSPTYRDDSGGIIVLHKLASILCLLGHNARIWEQTKPSPAELRTLRGWIKLFGRSRTQIKKTLRSKNTALPYGLKHARCADINTAIVIYPEIISGNPLRASRVVRWLLNKPGEICGNVDFSENEITFYYHKQFNDTSINPDYDHRLNVVDPKTDIYFEQNKNPRNGQCHMLRKGRHREHLDHDESSIGIDGLSHEEIAAIFNRTEYFVSYDLHTMYSRYAAMCGCIPVVVPELGLSKEEWRPDIASRYGIAYGWDDVSWAVSTRHLLLEVIKNAEASSRESVIEFLAIMDHHF
jgi:hypothetical protein